MNAKESSPVPAANWRTAAELAARYLVGEQELLDHSYQGTLALRRSPDGPVRFDECQVAQLFPLRGGRA